MSVGSAYKIAVQIALTQNVTRGLAMMATHFKAVNADVKELQQRLAAVGKMTLVGGGLAMAGGAGLKALDGPLQKALEYERYIANMRQQGLGKDQIEDAKKFVQATEMINTSALDRMRIFTESQGAFRESGKNGEEALRAAKVMTPVIANYEVTMTTLSGAKHAAAENALRNLNKTVEMMGGLNDTKRAQDIADGAFKAVQSSGKMVDERQLKQFFAYGSSATNQQDLRTVFGGLEPIIGELGGSTTAVGLRTAYTRTNGMMALPPRRMLEEMQRLGMTDATGRQQNSSLAHLQSTDIIGYAKEMMDRYTKAGIISQTDRERENAIIFGTNGSKVFNKIMSQMEVLQESLHAYDKAKGASEVVNDPENKKLMARQQLEKKLEDLQLVLAQDGGLIDMATRGLTAFSNAVGKITQFAKEHPTLTKYVVGAVALASALAIVGGYLLLLRAVVGSLMILGRFGAIGSMLKLLLPGIGTALSLLARAAMLAGRALLLTPIGLAITAIATAAYLLWKNWDTVGPLLTGIWDGIKNGVSALVEWFASKWKWFTGLFGSGDSSKEGAPGTVERERDRFIAPREAKMMLVNTQINLDGRPMANSLASYLVREVVRPTGGSAFDPNQALAPVGMPYAR